MDIYDTVNCYVCNSVTESVVCPVEKPLILVLPPCHFEATECAEKCSRHSIAILTVISSKDIPNLECTSRN